MPVGAITRGEGPRFVEQATAHNRALREPADRRIAAGNLIVVIDRELAPDHAADTADTVDPDASGCAKMAAVWCQVLDRALSDR